MDDTPCICWMRELSLEFGDARILCNYTTWCDNCGNEIKLDRVNVIYRGDEIVGEQFSHYFELMNPFSCLQCGVGIGGTRLYCPGILMELPINHE